MCITRGCTNYEIEFQVGDACNECVQTNFVCQVVSFATTAEIYFGAGNSAVVLRRDFSKEKAYVASSTLPAVTIEDWHGRLILWFWHCGITFSIAFWTCGIAARWLCFICMPQVLLIFRSGFSCEGKTCIKGFLAILGHVLEASQSAILELANMQPWAPCTCALSPVVGKTDRFAVEGCEDVWVFS